MKYKKIDAFPTGTAWLQFTCNPLIGREEGYEVRYELILPLREVDCRGTFDHSGRNVSPKTQKVWLDKNNHKHLPLGCTNIGTGNSKYPFNAINEDDLDLPFRDGVHCQWDNELLGGLPLIYSVRGELYQLHPRHESPRTERTAP